MAGHGHSHGAPGHGHGAPGHGHGASHAHAWEGGHGHGARPTESWRFGLAVALNAGFVAAEIVAGTLANSVALVADAAHNLSDVLGLLLAWGAARLAERRPSARRTYGFKRSTILAALANALLVLVAVGGVVWEAIGRLGAPPVVQSSTMIAVAAVGVAVNGLSALGFSRGSHDDLNQRGAYVHLLTDAAVSLGVVLSGIAIARTGANWIDPVSSLIVGAVVLAGVWALLRESIDLALDAVPPHVDMEAVRGLLAAMPGVREVHDLHVWAMSTTDVALTVHLVTEPEGAPRALLGDACRALRARFGIAHATIQIEPEDHADPCALGSGDHV